MGFFDKIKKIGIFNGFSELTEDFYEELEESLVMADLGAETTMEAVDELRERCKAQGIKDTEAPGSVCGRSWRNTWIWGAPTWT